ncbi:MAG: Gfo/Idh/MocA family oxidoreductase [Roseiflexaceae bacterium]|nr:Gfo/Idh/MocA family oxidoreductase [Roseiflexaceae bacterium]
MTSFTALLVGAGGMGQTWARNLHAHPDVRIGGWVDVRPHAAAQAATELELPPLHADTDFARALQAVGPDFVVDVTIPEAHHDVTLAALAAGLPVLGEKPMAASMVQARAMVAAAERANKLYMVSQSRRYDGRLQAFRQLIERTTGPLGLLNSDFYIGAHFGGFRDHMASPLLLDMAIHTFDAARFLCAADPVAVYCEEFNPSWSWYTGGACANAIFEMSGGLRYTYRGSWCAEGVPTSWEGEWRAVGPHGTATWNGQTAPSAEVVTERGGFVSTVAPASVEVAQIHGGIAGSLRDFLHALETGATPMGACHDNIKSLSMVFAAIESARSGRRVLVSEL